MIKEIPGFPFLKKSVPPATQTDRIPCPNCGEVVILAESTWMNEYTEEKVICCSSCAQPIGGFREPVDKKPTPGVDST